MSLADDFLAQSANTPNADKLNTAQELASNTPPDTAGKILSTSAKTGLDVGMVENNVDKLQNTEKVDPQSYAKTSPVSAGWMAEEPHRVAASKGAFKSHADLENTISKINGFEQLSETVMGGLDTLAAGAFRAPGYLAKMLDLNEKTKSSFGIVPGSKSDLTGRFIDSLIENPISKRMDELAEEKKQYSPVINPDADGVTDDLEHGKVGEAALKASSYVAQFVPKLLPWLGGSAPIAVAVDTLSSIGESGKQAKEKGATSDQASADAIGHGIVTAALDSLFLSKQLDQFMKIGMLKYGKDKMTQFVTGVADASLKHTVVNYPAGFASSYAGDLIDRVNYNNDAFNGSLERANSSGLQFTALGLGVHASASVLGAVRRNMAEARANGNADAYSAVGEQVKNNNLRKVSPEAMSDLVKNMVKNTGSKDIFIPKEAWDKHCQSQGLDPASAAREMGIKYSWSTKTGVDLQVPFDEWVSKTVDTPHYGALKNDIKFNSKDFSVNELKPPKQAEQPPEKSLFDKIMDPIRDFTGATKLLGEKSKPIEQPKPEEKPGFPTENISEETPYHRVVKDNISEVYKVIKPLFEKPEEFLSGNKPQKYKEMLDKASTGAAKRVVDAEMKRRENRQKSIESKQSKKILEEITNKYNSDRGVMAKSMLSGNKMPDGTAVPDAFKNLEIDPELQKDFIKYTDEDGKAQKLNNAHVDYNQHFKYRDTQKLDLIADYLKFNSTDEMLQAASKAPDKSVIEIAHQQAMEHLSDLEPDNEDHETLLADAVHSDEFAKIKYQELQDIQKSIFESKSMRRDMVNMVSKKMKPIERFKSEAYKAIGELKVGETSSVQHGRAGKRAGDEARNALLKGDLKKCFDKKQEELVNHYLYNAARDAEKKLEQGKRDNRKLNRSGTRESIGQGLNDSLGQLDSIRKQFGFPTRVTQEPQVTRNDWQDYVKALEPSFKLPDVVMSGQKIDYNDLSNDEFKSVVDSMKNIKTISLNIKKLTTNGEAIDLQSSANEFASKIAVNRTPVDLPKNQTPNSVSQNIKASLRWVDSYLTRFTYLINRFDPSGTFTKAHELFVRPIRYMENKEDELRKIVYESEKSSGDQLTRPERVNRTNKSIFIKEAKHPEMEVNIGTEDEPLMKTVPEHDGNFTQENLEHMVMYMGDQYAHDELCKNNGYQPETLQAIVDGKLDKRSVDRINKRYEINQKLYEEQKALEIRHTGVSPKDTLPRAFEIKLKDGSTAELKGGHADVRLRADFSKEIKPTDKLDEAFATNYGKPSTNKYSLEARVGTNGHTLDLTDASWVSRKLKQIKDISGREAISDLNKLMNNNTVTGAIDKYFGNEYNQLIKGFTERMSGMKEPQEAPWLDKLRNRTVVVDIGMNMMTALKHVIQLPMASQPLKGYMFSSFKDLFSNPFDMSRQLSEMEKLVPEYERRNSGNERNLWQFTEENNTAKLKNAYDETARNLSFAMIKGIDKIGSGLLVHAAYKKIMSEGLPKEGILPGDSEYAAKYAAEILKEYKGSGDLSDQAKVQTMNSAMRLMTMFYSPEGINYNQLVKNVSRFQYTKDKGQLAVALGLSVVVGTLGRVMMSAPINKKEELGQKAANDAINYFAYMAPIVGDSASLFEGAFEHREVSDLDLSPAVSELGHAITGAAAIGRDLTGEHNSKSMENKELDTMALLAGFPTPRIWKLLSQ